MLVLEALRSRNPVTVQADDGVPHATRVLLRHDSAAAAVLDATGRLVGVVSESDLLRDRVGTDPRAHLLVHDDGRDEGAGDTGVHSGSTPSGDRPVAEVMSPDPVTVDARADLADAVTLLVDLGYRAVPVLEGHRLVGLLTRGDVLRTLAGDDEEVATAVRERFGVDLPGQEWTVSVSDGVVTLTGQHGAAEQRVASVVARSVPGVRRVAEVADAESYDAPGGRTRPYRSLR